MNKITKPHSVRLDKYSKNGYEPKGGGIKKGLWYLVNSLLFCSYYFPFNFLKIRLLRSFGAKVGDGVVIKPAVNIKYPWLLEVGDYCWIGEKVWIDNLVYVKLGDHVCLSQGALLLTGSHDYKKSTFDLRTGEIILEDGVWIGAQAVVCLNVTCRRQSVLAVNSVLTHDTKAQGVYQGNPASWKRNREIEE